MRKVLLPILFSLLCLACGTIGGFRLVPDSATYASGNYWRYPLANIPGILGGMYGVIIFSSTCAGLLVAMMPTISRQALLIASCAGWLVFPGMDSAGALLCVSALRFSRFLAVPAFLFHPISALTLLPLAIRRNAITLSVSFGIVAAIMTAFVWYEGEGVSTISHITYMSRYAIVPLSVLIGGLV
jgi:hypothetical protein